MTEEDDLYDSLLTQEQVELRGSVFHLEPAEVRVSYSSKAIALDTSTWSTAPRSVNPNVEGGLSTSPGSTCLYISDLTWWTSEDDLRSLIATTRTDIRPIAMAFYENKTNGKSRGIAVVQFANMAAAQAAHEVVSKSEIHGRRPTVSFANASALQAARQSGSTQAVRRGGAKQGVPTMMGVAPFGMPPPPFLHTAFPNMMPPVLPPSQPTASSLPPPPPSQQPQPPPSSAQPPRSPSHRSEKGTSLEGGSAQKNLRRQRSQSPSSRERQGARSRARLRSRERRRHSRSRSEDRHKRRGRSPDRDREHYTKSARHSPSHEHQHGRESDAKNRKSVESSHIVHKDHSHDSGSRTGRGNGGESLVFDSTPSTKVPEASMQSKEEQSSLARRVVRRKTPSPSSSRTEGTRRVSRIQDDHYEPPRRPRR